MTETQERRRLILHSAARLFAHKGVPATTMREIAADVGMLSGSLYHHFASKDAMVAEVLDGYLADLLTGYRAALDDESDPRQSVRGLIAASVRAAARHPHATDIYRREIRRPGVRSAALSAAATEVQRTWLAALERGRDSGAFRDDVPVGIVYRLVRDALFHSAVGSGDTPERLAETFTTLVLDGICAPRTPVAAPGAAAVPVAGT